ncbi:winged helix-turn-helix domain-containing protein, partial [Achromobacter xylosoxidans]
MTVREDILQFLRAQQRENLPWVSSSELAYRTGVSWSTVKRQLENLRKAGAILREGQGRATRYRITDETPASTLPTTIATRLAEPASETVGMIWSERGQALLARLRQPLSAREPVGCKRLLNTPLTVLLMQQVATDAAAAQR